MVAGIDGDDFTPLNVERDEIEVVSEFIYLRSCLCDVGEVTIEVICRIAKASKIFGIVCLRLFS